MNVFDDEIGELASDRQLRFHRRAADVGRQNHIGQTEQRGLEAGT